MKKHPLLPIILSAAIFAQALEFTQSPSMVKDAGSSWRITFAVDESTDVEVSIVNSAANTFVRHLAAGVLGGSAPAPLVKNSLSQTIIWDGLDDYRTPAVAPENLTVRVRAGMGVRQDAFAGGDPYEYSAGDPGSPFGGMARGSDGSFFLMYRPSGVTPMVVRQYSATGEYIKTIFPIPGSKPADDFTGWGLNLLTVTDYSPKTQDYYGPLMTSSPLGYFGTGGLLAGPARGQLGVVDNNSNKIWVLDEDGTCDAAMASANAAFLASPAMPGGLQWGARGARFFAVSPDYSYFLLSGFAGPDTGFWRDGRLFKVNMATRAASLLFDLDTVLPASSRGAVLGNDYRTELSGVALGDSGRIFLCDRMTNRLLVLDSTGVVLKSFPVSSPDNVAFCASSGAVYLTRMNRTDGYFLEKIANWRNETAVTSSMLIKKGDGTYGVFGYCDAGSPNQTFISTVPSSQGTLIWLAARIGGIVIYQESGDTFLEYKNFRKLSKQAFTGIKRLAVDPLTETAYVTASGTTVYKVEDWTRPAFVPCSTNTGRQLNGYDLAVDPLQRHLFVRQIGTFDGPFQGDINRFSLGRYLTPAPLAVMDTHMVVDSYCVPGTMSVGTADYGFGVAPNGHMAVMSTRDYPSLAPISLRYHPVSDTQHAYRPLVLIPIIAGGTKAPGGGVKFDLQGNLYVGERPPAAFAGLPPIYTSDRSRNQTMGAIYRYNAQGSLDGDLFTAPTPSADKIYDVDCGQFGNTAYNACGCACMTSTFGMDAWGRLYAPNGPFQKITVLDNEGNRTLRFGSYGNADDVAAEAAGAANTSGRCYLAYPFCVEATDDYIYATDPGNAILTRFEKTFILDNVPSMSTASARPVALKSPLALSAFPNPFMPQGRIQVALPRAARLTLDVLDVSGRLVARLAQGTFSSGAKSFVWNGKRSDGSSAAAGLYFYRLVTDRESRTIRTILAR